MRGIVVFMFLAGCVAGPQDGYTQNGYTGRAAANIQPANIHVNFDRTKILQQSVTGDAGVAGRKVGMDDPVRVASISKMVMSIAVMRLVQQGIVDLDKDVGIYLGWPIRNPAYPDHVISLRMLMSHTSSLTDDAGYILPLDGDLSVIVADPKAWDKHHAPGQYFRYANFNSPIIAAVMEAATNERFDKLMERLVLSPLRLDACYNWGSGCIAGRRAQAAALLRPDGTLAKDGPVAAGQINAGQDDCNFVRANSGSCDIALYLLGKNGSAFSPQGGLRISASDMVKIGQVLLNKGQPLLSPVSFAEMTKPAWQFDGSNGDDEDGFFNGYGLGFHIIEQKGGAKWIGHAGEAYGLRAGFWLNPASGKGRVRYVTMVDEFAKVGHCFDSCP